MKLNVVGPSYQLDARSFDCQRTVNMFPLISESGTSKSVAALQGTPGLDLFAMLPTGPGRGAKSTANDDRGFAVAGGKLYEVFANGTYAERGSLMTNVGLVSLAENGEQLMIVDGSYGYILTLATNAWAQITDPDFPVSTQVASQDGYFLVFQKGTGKPYVSAIQDGFVWDPLDFTSTEVSPDNLVALLSDGGQMWFGGSRSVEIFNNTGNTAFPFERQQGAFIPTGVAAAETFKRFDNTIVWLGIDEEGRGIVWKAEGYEARRLSTQAIEARIASVPDFTESYAWVYHQKGHVFYCLQVKGLDATLVYDGSTGLWHERSFYNKQLGRPELHRGVTHFFFAQRNLVLDRETGAVYNLSPTAYSDAGNEIHRERIFPHIAQESVMIPHNELVIDMEPGVGTTTGQGVDPQVMLTYSDDGGFTWSKQRTDGAGRKGKYKKRVRFTRLGSARDRVYKVRMTDPVFWQINAGYLNPPKGA